MLFTMTTVAGATEESIYTLARRTITVKETIQDNGVVVSTYEHMDAFTQAARRHIDWKTAFTAALLGFLGAYLIGGYLNMPDAGAIVAIAYVGGRILWYLKRLEARQEPKDTVADAPADTAAADTTPEGSGTEG